MSHKSLFYHVILSNNSVISAHFVAIFSQNDHFGVAGFAIASLVDSYDAVFQFFSLRLSNYAGGKLLRWQ